METQHPESLGCSKSSSKREVCSDTGLIQEIRKIPNEQSNFITEGTGERVNEAQDQQKEGNNKDQSRNK